jgi:hypothetical protein
MTTNLTPIGEALESAAPSPSTLAAAERTLSDATRPWRSGPDDWRVCVNVPRVHQLTPQYRPSRIGSSYSVSMSAVRHMGPCAPRYASS